MNNNIKSIQIKGKEWRDKMWGNTYFSCRVIVIYDKDIATFEIPFTYGYGEYYIQAANELLIKENVINNNEYNLSRYCRENNIELITTMKTNCKKKDVKNLDPYTF